MARRKQNKQKSQRTFYLLLLTVLLCGAFGLNFQKTIYERKVETPIASEELWAMLQAALKDSSTSKIWPNRFETVRTKKLAEREIIRVDYHIPLLGSFQQEYEIKEIGLLTTGNGFQFVYQPKEGHPLEGESKVTITPAENKGSTLHWSGWYRPRKISFAPLFLRFFFLPKFFEDLEKKLRMIE